MKRIKAWLQAWRDRREIKRLYKEYDAGFEYALSVLRHEKDLNLHQQLRDQAFSDSDSAFCFGMRIAIRGWKS